MGFLLQQLLGLVIKNKWNTNMTNYEIAVNAFNSILGILPARILAKERGSATASKVSNGIYLLMMKTDKQNLG
jgi:hypothetical protein